MLYKIHSEGHQVLFITMRGEQDNNKEWCIENTKKLLQELMIPYRVIFNVQSPRFVFDDIKGSFNKRKRNSRWI